ncbi:MAG: DMT family transporter [Planctomycetota bacterium]|jgi:drug/metabolite transporter (DMT)-like permease
MSYPGEIAALTTALLFALSSLGFALASQRVGSFVVNQLRIFLAMLLLMLLHLLAVGSFWPDALSNRQAWYLVLSGVVGLALGDLFYFHALGKVGPRLGTLLMSTFPIFTVLTEGLWLGYWPNTLRACGIAATLGGVAVVLTEDRGRDRVWAGRLTTGAFVAAIATGVLGAVGQGAGLVLSKIGMAAEAGSEEPVLPLSATVVRMLAGLIGMIVVLPVYGLLRRRRAAGTANRWWRDRKALSGIAVGALLGPTLGVWLSQIAVAETRAGIAATLIALTPVFMIPIARWYYRERVSMRAMVGTMIAFAGIAMLLWPAGA